MQRKHKRSLKKKLNAVERLATNKGGRLSWRALIFHFFSHLLRHRTLARFPHSCFAGLQERNGEP